MTSFIGREAEMNHVRQLLADNRVVTLTGADGVGKTRLALQVAGQVACDFGGGQWYVDLRQITDRNLMSMAMVSALGLPKPPSRSTMDTLVRFINDRRILVVLDHCEHLLDACATLVGALGACPGLKVLATSSESIGAAGEVSWRVPSLSLSDEAVELFATRARRARPDFAIDANNGAAVAAICQLLDGLPLAIELAAARVGVLSVAEILDSLHDRFRLLNGAVRRGQTLRAAVQWSYALLSEPQRVLLNRLAMFTGAFDLDAAQAVGAYEEFERCQVLDHLTPLADKSLIAAESGGSQTRYRLPQTVRQYALQKLAESGEADVVCTRLREHYGAGTHGLPLIGVAGSEINYLPTVLAPRREKPGTVVSRQPASLQPSSPGWTTWATSTARPTPTRPRDGT
ncbi:ATP-binding protein [Mycobacterium simulans]|uniref:ATP-binding protein n=1 Tax=Mycobacterium simulans TaxID=627089 RepID=UPI00174CF75C